MLLPELEGVGQALHPGGARPAQGLGGLGVLGVVELRPEIGTEGDLVPSHVALAPAAGRRVLEGGAELGELLGGEGHPGRLHTPRG
jgi:hypothetical protein